MVSYQNVTFPFQTEMTAPDSVLHSRMHDPTSFGGLLCDDYQSLV